MNEFDVKKSLQNAIDVTFIYSTPIIYLVGHPSKDEIPASGTFVIIAGKKGLLTNHHVFKMFSDKKLPYIGVPAKETEILHSLFFTTL